MDNNGSSILMLLILIAWVTCVSLGVSHFFETNILISLTIGIISFFIFIKCGDIISELHSGKNYDSEIKYIFTKSCKKCDSPLIQNGHIQTMDPNFKVHCNSCGHEAIVDKNYNICA